MVKTALLKTIFALIGFVVLWTLSFRTDVFANDELPAPNIHEGKRTFTVHCVQCHGLEGKGGGHSRSGPNLTDNVTIHGDSLEDIYQVIAEGVPNTGMPKWKQKMGPGRIQDLALFVHSITGTELGEAKPNQRDIINAKTFSETDGTISAQSLFRLHCSQCHGASGSGGIGPNLTDTATIHGDELNQIRDVIANGVADKLMPAWSPKFDDATIESLTSYVLSIKGSDSSPLPTPEVSQAKLLDPELQGRITEGKRTFIVHCEQCHGDGGRGMMGPNLTDEFTLHGETFDDILRVITNGVPAMQMPTWGQRLSEKRIREVAEYVLTLKGSRPTGVKPKDTPQDILSDIINVSTLSKSNGTISAQSLFRLHCAQCHGPSGGGGIGPNLTDAATIHGSERQQIRRIITNGVADKLMPAWSPKFDEDTIEALTSFVLSIRGNPTVVPAQEPSQTKVLEPELQSRINQGKRTFTVHCIECHGSGGKGGMGPNLTDEFTLHGGNVENFASTITNGVPSGGMPRWGTKLSAERIGSLAEYVFSITGSKPTGIDPGTRTSRLVNSKYMRPRLNPESMKSGKRTFVVHCEQCHGLGGRGGAGPNLTDEFTLHGETFDDILNVVTKGIPAMQMPTWSQMLTKKRIREVAGYVLSLKGTRPTGIEPDSQRPEGLQGLSPFR